MKRFFKIYGFTLKSLWKTNIQLLHGAWKIVHLPEPIITIFGGSRIKQGSFFARQAHALGERLAQEGISVITGGGPGIMQAAYCSIEHKEKKVIHSLGVRVKDIDPQGYKSPCWEDYVVMDYFFSRKWLMTQFSIAFAVFPGGFGTLDELGEISTLMQTKKLPGEPIVLIGVDYWKPLMDWFTNSALKEGLILEENLRLINVTDDLDEAFCLLKQHCELVGNAPSNKKE